MMNCHFCKSELNDTAPAGSLKEVLLLYVCNKCQPHEVLYRELYDQNTDELIADAIRIDDYLIMRDYQENSTEFNKTIRDRDSQIANVTVVFKMDGIWEIPCADIEMVKQKLNIYTIFS